jgi:hypothetical protein
VPLINPDGLAVAVALMMPCAGSVAIVLAVLYNRRSMAAMRHKTAIELAQRGVPVPPELLVDLGPGRRYNDLRSGLVLAGLGVGVIAFALSLPQHPAWGIGLVPLFAGLGYFTTWLVTGAGRAQS